MKHLDTTVRSIAQKIGLTPDEIAQRKAFLEFDADDIALLRKIHLALAPHLLTDRVYDDLPAFQTLEKLLPDASAVKRLRQAHTRYFSRLTEGEYEQEYIEDGVRAGIMHRHSGLGVKSHIGPYRKYLSAIAPMLWELQEGDQEQFLSAFDALLKVVFLDLGLSLEAYFEIDRQAALRHQNFAEQMIAAMQSGAMVLDAQCRVCSMNRMMREICGIASEATVLGQPLHALIQNPQLLESIASPLAARELVLELPGETGTRHINFHISETTLEGETLRLLVATDVTQRVCAEEEWKLFRFGMDHSTDAIYVVDRESMRIVDVNETACKMLGYSREEMLQLGPYQTRVGISRSRLAEHYDAIACSISKYAVIKASLRHKDDFHLPVEIHLRALHSAGRQIMVVLIKDMTERLQAQAALRASEERFSATFNQAAVGLAHAAIDGSWMRTNQKLLHITGYIEEELLELSVFDITHPDDIGPTRESMRRIVRGEIQNYSNHKRYRCRSGNYVWVAASVSLVRDAHGAPDYFIVAVEDISQRKQLEQELRHSACHDALTDLPNRMLLQDRLSQAIVYANRAHRHVAVMLIDLDRFKNVNDSLGHDVGDQVIIESARRLTRHTRDGDTVARLGGDEFVVILADVGQEDDVIHLAQRMLRTLAEPIVITGQALYTSGSIGISLYPKDGDDGCSLLQSADMAMYQAKKHGGNHYQFYAHEMNARMLERLRLDARLRRALEQHELVLHYQPQVDIATGSIVGVEALVRWQPHDGPMIHPNEFIPVAEETGLIVPIGEWVLRTACAQSQAWQRAGLPAVRIAVNLSARQFMQQDIVKWVSQVLDETGCSASMLELEITESVIMENAETVIDTLYQLSEMGVSLSIDDFGTGYSSLSYLQRFPIHTLKIDRSFIRDIVSADEDAPIAKAVILLAHSMNLQVIAEGVETEQQIAFLRKHHCDQMQGYYFSRPVSAAQMEHLFRVNRVRDHMPVNEETAAAGKVIRIRG